MTARGPAVVLLSRRRRRRTTYTDSIWLSLSLSHMRYYYYYYYNNARLVHMFFYYLIFFFRFRGDHKLLSSYISYKHYYLYSDYRRGYYYTYRTPVPGGNLLGFFIFNFSVYRTILPFGNHAAVVEISSDPFVPVVSAPRRLQRFIIRRPNISAYRLINRSPTRVASLSLSYVDTERY